MYHLRIVGIFSPLLWVLVCFVSSSFVSSHPASSSSSSSSPSSSIAAKIAVLSALTTQSGNRNLTLADPTKSSRLGNPPDPFAWDASEAIYTLSNYHGPQESYATFSITALQCSRTLLEEMGKRRHTPETPYPGGKYSCDGASGAESIRLSLVADNPIGWQMTYLDVAEILVQMCNAVLYFNDGIPFFTLDVEWVGPPPPPPFKHYYPVASGSWGPAAQLIVNTTVASTVETS